MTEDVEMELRGRVTTLENAAERQHAAIDYLLLAIVALAIGGLLLSLTIRKANR